MVVATLRLPRRGAENELDRLYRRHADEVLRYAQLVLRSQPDAEDVVQTTFVRAFRALERGEQVQKPRNWLIKIAHNECRRFLAARKFEAELPETLSAETHEPGRAEDLTRALQVLAPAQRQALVLRELEGRSYAEIADTLGLSQSAVETLIFRARRAVREQLELGVSCEEFPALLEAGDRARVRAHTRVCADCATLERQARGRKSALHRIASGFFFPKLVAGLLATGAAVSVTVAALPHRTPLPDVTPLQVDKPAVIHVAPVAVPSPRRANHVPGTHRAPATRRIPAASAAHHRAATQQEPTPTPAPEPQPPAPAPDPEPAAPPSVPPPPVHETPAPQVPAPVLPLDTSPLAQIVPPGTISAAVAPVVQTVAPVVQSVTTVVQTTVQNTVPTPVQSTVQDTVQTVVDPVAQAVPPVTAPQLPLPPVLP